MRRNKKQLQEMHDRLRAIALEYKDNRILEECEDLQNHIDTLQDEDDSSNPPGNPPPPPGPVRP